VDRGRAQAHLLFRVVDDLPELDRRFVGELRDEEDFRDDDEDFFDDDDLVDADFFDADDDFFAGTFAPAFRASDRPIAIACLRLVTFLPDRPLFSVPVLRSCIARLTFD
jgi:hypothetical protein